MIIVCIYKERSVIHMCYSVSRYSLQSVILQDFFPVIPLSRLHSILVALHPAELFVESHEMLVHLGVSYVRFV